VKVTFSRPFLGSFARVMAGAATSQRTAAVPAPGATRLSRSRRLSRLQSSPARVYELSEALERATLKPSRTFEKVCTAAKRPRLRSLQIHRYSPYIYLVSAVLLQSHVALTKDLASAKLTSAGRPRLFRILFNLVIYDSG
jgi:hypothetical protein